jgi:hypothetical protein
VLVCVGVWESLVSFETPCFNDMIEEDQANARVDRMLGTAQVDV